MPPIVIAAAIVRDAAGRVLLVRKRGTRRFMLPGGKPEPGETMREALVRELVEELVLPVPPAPAAARFLGVFAEEAANEPGRLVEGHVFDLGSLAVSGVAAEIEEHLWADPLVMPDVPLAPLFARHILPRLRDPSSQTMTNLPATMTAIAIPKPGGPEALVPETRPVPAPGPGEVLVKVAAAGVNRPDVLQRAGGYPPPKGASDIPGLEIAGEVVALGQGASRFKLGDKVCGLVSGGGYAEYCPVHETNALPVPKGLSMIEAASIPETFFTVWSNVFDRAGLEPGETILIHGGTSGIGVTAIQLAKAFGATVIATAGSDAKCAACRELGADHAINYRYKDFVAGVAEATGGKGANVILDMVGGDYVARNIVAAAADGRIVQIAFLNGSEIKADLRWLMLKRLTLTGSTLRIRDIAFKARLAEALAEKVWPLLEAGKVKVVMDSTYPLREAAKAHARMETNAHIGKIALVA